MVIDMNESKLETLEQIREFLPVTSDVAFAIPAEEPRLRAFVAKVLQRFRYFSRPKGQRGLLFEYMQRLSGYSRQQLSRLIAQYRDTHSIEPGTRACWRRITDHAATGVSNSPLQWCFHA